MKDVKPLTIMAVGDTFLPKDQESSEAIFANVKDVISEADIRFAQIERVFSHRGAVQWVGLSPYTRRDPKLAQVYKWAGFNVVSTASNHTGDLGPEAAEDTVEVFKKLGIATVGSGKDISEARKPAVFNLKGVKVAFLGYASTILPQYWATEERAGVAPVRAHTYYEPYEYQPGSPPRVVTIPFEDDIALMQEDIKKAKQMNDVVIMSIHWGVHFVPKPLADYQKIVAQKAVEAGVSVILGHHPHCLQGIEILQGNGNKGIVFYSLGNFHSSPPTTGKGGFYRYCAPMGIHKFEDVYNKELEAGHHYDRRRFATEGGIAKIHLSKKGVERVSLIPTFSTPTESRPDIFTVHTLTPRQKKFKDIYEHLKWTSSGLKGGADMSVEKGEIVIFKGDR